VSAFFNTHREKLIALSARHAVPTIYFRREFASAGGLMSYGPQIGESYHQAGILASRILRGDKPGDLPVQQPTKFELVERLLETYQILSFRGAAKRRTRNPVTTAVSNGNGSGYWVPRLPRYARSRGMTAYDSNFGNTPLVIKAMIEHTHSKHRKLTGQSADVGIFAGP